VMAALAAAQPALRLPQMASRSPVAASTAAAAAAGPRLPARCRVARPVCLAGTAIGSVSAISGERSRFSAVRKECPSGGSSGRGRAGGGAASGAELGLAASSAVLEPKFLVEVCCYCQAC